MDTLARGSESSRGSAYGRSVIGREVRELDTPALLIDAAALDRNLRRMADDCAALGKALRPHAKAHKSPVVGLKQLAAGAVGVTCAKIGEAEVMIAGGIHDVLISTVVGSPAKAVRVAELAQESKVATVIDSETGARWLSEAATAVGTTVDVLIDVNVGQDRTGVQPEDALALASAVVGMRSLRLRGLQGYEGNLQHVYSLDERARRVGLAMDQLARAYSELSSAGFDMTWVTTGGTGTYRLGATRSFVTEVQPGSYIVMDADYLKVAGHPFEVALSVLTTVIGTYAGRAIVDAGSKSVSTDAGQPVLKDRMGIAFATAGDEHGKLTSEGDEVGELRVGQKLQLLPSHCDTTVNLHDVFYVTNSGTVEDVWPISARGRVQ
jgi:D-serine deaminase-like pyridoxal phosphate-dependent protein